MATPALDHRVIVSIDDDPAERIATLLDVLLCCEEARALVQFHDRDGTILDAVRGWANENNLSMVRVRNSIGPRSWTTYDVDIGGDGVRGVAVHDCRSEEWAEAEPIVDPTDAKWSPAHHTAMPERP